MSKILSDLRKLIGRSAPITHGTIVGISGQVLTVSASEIGERAFYTVNPGAFAVGDTVRFQGDVLLGKIKSDTAVPTYSV